MSIVVAVKKDNKIAIAADERESFYGTVVDRENYRPNKILNIWGNYIGIAGNPIYYHILKDYFYKFWINGNKPTGHIFENVSSVYSVFINLYSHLKEYGFIREQPPGADSAFFDFTAEFLIANRHGIFLVDPSCIVNEFKEYYSIGAGQPYSIGALSVMYNNPKINAAELARDATLVAIKHNKDCWGKVNLIEVV